MDRAKTTDLSSHDAIACYRADRPVIVQPGETIFKAGDVMRCFYRVVSGVARGWLCLPDGRRQVTDFFFPGDILGLHGNAAATFTAEAISEVHLAVLWLAPRSGAVTQAGTAETRGFIDALFQHLAQAREQMILLGRKTAEERLATFILRLGAHAGTAGGGWIDIPMTRNDVADHLGLTLETVCRMFTSLRERKLIASTSPGKIRIIDRAAFQALADGARRHATAQHKRAAGEHLASPVA